MANAKISALPPATTPLAGTEVLPIVQSGTTKQVSIDNLTAGKAVATAALTVTGLATVKTSTTGDIRLERTSNVGAGSEPSHIYTYAPNASGTVILLNGITVVVDTATAGSEATHYEIYQRRTGTYTKVLATNSTGDLSISVGNVIQGTAAKGINFTANTPAAGMTSQLLNWYEEGTWTPNQGAGLTVVGAFSSTGRYTRIGRQVSISGTVTGATSVAVTAAGVITSNLPFTVVTAGHGDATNVAINASATVICTGTSVTSAAAIAATATITFSATYFV